MSKHCWHKAGMSFGNSDKGEICCFCGTIWDPYRKVPLAGHGKFSPDLRAPEKPTESCVYRQNEPPISR
jgi:hypothetical protein